ncbi:hypothetical protein BH24ACT21_BH24ACT21_18570 [soil metagenome]
MKPGLVVVLAVLVSLLAACGSDSEVRGATNEAVVETVEVEITKKVTVEKTVTSGAEGSTTGREEGGATRDALPGPAVPSEADIKRTVGETATLESGNSVSVFSGQSGVPAEDSVYEARAGMDFFVVEAEVCVSESATEPSYFTSREFSLLNDDTVRRMASVPTKLPALRGSSVDPGECNRGNITFQVEDGEEPRAVIYEGSSTVEWELGEG